MASSAAPAPLSRPYAGVFPVAPTPFAVNGDVDLDGQRRVLDCMIDQGVDGICILANYSEQFLLTDEERDMLTELCLSHVAGRVPIIVTTSHFSTRVAAERARKAAQAGASMLMLMPPYHGTGLRADEKGMLEHFAQVAEAGGIPIMVQDAPLSGVALSAAFLVRLAREVPLVRYFKIEVAGAAAKLRGLIDLGGDVIEGPFDGEEAITLMADLDAGATGAMTGGAYPDGIRQIMDPYFAGDREGASAAYERWLPLINYENRQCGLSATKVLMKEGGVIRSDAVRHPLQPLHAETKKGLIEIAQRLNPIVLSWGR
jgi:2-keto-3-deoxy-L-arabinonate dehydratase